MSDGSPGSNTPGGRTLAGLKLPIIDNPTSVFKLLLGQDVDHGVRRLRVEFGRIRTVESEDVAAEFNRRDLEPEANPEERDFVLARVAGRSDFAFDPAPPEASRDHDAVEAREGLLEHALLDLLGLDPPDLDVAARGGLAVVDRFDVGDVGVAQLRVFPDDRNFDLALDIREAVDELVPLRQRVLARGKPEPLEDVVREPLLFEDPRDVVDGRCVVRGNDPALGDVAKRGDLAPRG